MQKGTLYLGRDLGTDPALPIPLLTPPVLPLYCATAPIPSAVSPRLSTPLIYLARFCAFPSNLTH